MVHKRMIREKKAKAGTAVIVLVLGMLLLLFVAAENLSQDTGYHSSS